MALWQEYRISVSRQTLGRELNATGYRKLTARPKHHAQDPDAIEALKNVPAATAEIAAGTAKGKGMEIWFQDEARIGQKNKITRHWTKRGTRPSAPHDQRTRSAYIFGAICPRLGKAAVPVMPLMAPMQSSSWIRRAGIYPTLSSCPKHHHSASAAKVT